MATGGENQQTFRTARAQRTVRPRWLRHDCLVCLVCLVSNEVPDASGSLLSRHASMRPTPKASHWVADPTQVQGDSAALFAHGVVIALDVL